MIPQQDISPTNTLPSLIESTTDTPTAPINPENNNNNNNDPSDDDDDDDDDNHDVDCFPRQDKQPVPAQDISPTVPTANNTPPSLIASSTDKSTAPMNTDNNNNNNRRHTAPARTKQSRKPPNTHTVVPKAPLLVWDGTQYQLDYNHDHRPISV